MQPAQERSGVGAALERTAEGLGRLMGEHVALLRAELLEDARVLGLDLRPWLVSVTCLVAGYGLMCSALVVSLIPVLGLLGSLLTVAVLNLGLGAGGLVRMGRGGRHGR